MPYHLQLGSDKGKLKDKAVVVNTITGKTYSNKPIPIEKAKAQLRVLRSIKEPSSS